MFALLSLVALVLAVVALRRLGSSGDLQRRLSKLESEVEKLRGLVPRNLGDQPQARPVPQVHSASAETGPVPSTEPAAGGEQRVEAPPRVTEPLRASPPPKKAPPWALPPAREPVKIDWERWIGVRGAAVLGGVVLALAGLFFFRYSIEHGLVPPWVRVVSGILTGIACIGGSEWILRRRYAFTANAVAGGGVVILYASIWAARALYGLIGTGMAFTLMILVTTSCCALSWRHVSQVVAILGLVGGFLTPLLLSSGSDRPIGLFAYILLLDAGLLYVANRRQWPILSILSLIGTFLYQVAWIWDRMGPDRLVLGLGILGVFAVVFAVAGRMSPRDEKGHWLISQAGGVLLPFAFALYFASDAELTPHLYPLALLLLPLSVGASWIGRVQKQPLFGLAAASGVVAVVALWLLSHGMSRVLAWEAAGLCIPLALVFHLFVEWDRKQPGWNGPAPAALVANLGLLCFLIVTSVSASGVPPWPWITAWAALAALLMRHAEFPARATLHLVAAAGLGLGLALLHISHSHDPHFPGAWVYLGTLLAASIAFQALALRRIEMEVSRYAEHAAAFFPVLLLISFIYPGFPQNSPAWLLLSSTVALGFLVLLAGTRVGCGQWLLAAVAATVLAQSAWCWEVGRLQPGTALVALVIQGAAVLLFTVWPFLTTERFRSDRWAWYASALAGPVWFPSLKRLFTGAFGDAFIGLLPVLLGATSLAAASRARNLWPEDAPERKSTLVWFLAIALGFISVAIPLQLEKEWITIGWALDGLAALLLWKRMDHPGLKYLGLALCGGATIRLIANEAVLGYYPRPSWRIVNWLLYTYLVPAGALVWSATVLGRNEVERAREWEKVLYTRGYPVGALGTGLAAVLVAFVWINLAIADWFSAGTTLRVSFEHMAARDLTTSIAWAAYALLLLGVGVRFASRGLRWVSLGLLMGTIVKVFLYDLGELQDLYRVASLLGLAFSLIAVSLAYQRFVLRDTPSEEK